MDSAMVRVDAFLTKYELSSVGEVVEGGMTALHYAAYENNGDAVQMLAAASADLNVGDTASDDTAGSGGVTPLMLASLHGCIDAAAALIEAGASLNQ